MSGRRSSNAEGNPEGTDGGCSCSVNDAPARDRTRVSAEQQADLIFRLFDVLLDIRDDLLRRMDQLLALPNLQQCCKTTLFPGSGSASMSPRESSTCARQSPAPYPVRAG